MATYMANKVVYTCNHEDYWRQQQED